MPLNNGKQPHSHLGFNVRDTSIVTVNDDFRRLSTSMADHSVIVSDSHFGSGDERPHLGHMVAILGLTYQEVIAHITSNDSDSEEPPAPHTLYSYMPKQTEEDRENSILSTMS